MSREEGISLWQNSLPKYNLVKLGLKYFRFFAFAIKRTRSIKDISPLFFDFYETINFIIKIKKRKGCFGCLPFLLSSWCSYSHCEPEGRGNLISKDCEICFEAFFDEIASSLRSSQ
jgi:hypothetical protein